MYANPVNPADLPALQPRPNGASSDMIESFQAVTGADVDTATRFLKGAGNDADRAINEYFDNPTKYLNQDAYDESAWNTDRSGDFGGMGNVPAFNIETVEGREWAPGGHSVAPSRPPSRSGSISSTRGIPDTSGMHSVYQSQELGVINSSQTASQISSGFAQNGSVQYGPNFHPATQDYYDKAQWSMTLHPSANQSVVELIPDPPPAKRIRKDGDPVFMKPLASKDLLPSFITMVYAVPLARRGLMLETSILNDYGRDPSWWQGTTIKLPAIVHSDSEHSVDSGYVDEEPVFSSSNSTSRDDINIVYEAQRLMAFHADSKRSYGSAGALADILEKTQTADTRAQTLYDKFLVQWEVAAAKLEPDIFEDGHFFRSTVSQLLAGQDKAVEDHFFCLEVQLGRLMSGNQQTLYEALDEMIWTDASIDQAITTVAPILVIRVTQQDASISSLNMDVPATWYVDRYLQENLKATKVMRQSIARCQADLRQLDERKQNLATFTNSKTGKAMDIKAMLATATSAFDRPKKRKLDDEDEEAEDEEMIDQTSAEPFVSRNHDEIPVPEPKPDIIAQLEAISSHVDRKVERLEQEQARIQRELQQHASLFKEPATNDEDQALLHAPQHRYTLCGAAIDNRTMFVLDRTRPSLIDLSDSNAPVSDQWWRFGYSNDPLVSKQRSTVDVVLGAASSGSREVLLVYASDEAIDPRHLENFTVPEPLKAFIKKDNAYFAEEQEQEVLQEAQEIAPLTGWTNEEEPWQMRSQTNEDTTFVRDDGEGDYAAKEEAARLQKDGEQLEQQEKQRQRNGDESSFGIGQQIEPAGIKPGSAMHGSEHFLGQQGATVQEPKVLPPTESEQSHHDTEMA